jgi:hypothetical protein
VIKPGDLAMFEFDVDMHEHLLPLVKLQEHDCPTIGKASGIVLIISIINGDLNDPGVPDREWSWAYVLTDKCQTGWITFYDDRCKVIS